MPLLCCLAVAAGLLPNASFEDGPAGWKLLGGPPPEIIEGDAHDGGRFVRLTDPAPEVFVSLDSAHVPARVGGAYTLTGWLRTSDTCQPGLYLQFFDDAEARIAETHARATGPTDGWVRLTVDAVAPARAVTVSALLYGFVGDTGRFDADDIQLNVVGGEPALAARRAEARNMDTVEIGSRRELFVDAGLIDSLAGGAQRRLHHPEPREIALPFDAPWEGPTCAYATVIADGDLVRLYYRGQGGEAAEEATCYAESRDGGRSFIRPELGLHEFAGSRRNNIILRGDGVHNFAPFLDTNPAAKPAERYKALGSTQREGYPPLLAFASPDGIHWQPMRPEPVLTDGAFDSQNLAFWDAARGRYAAYYRDFADGIRGIKVAWSDDFLTWTPGEWLDFGDAPAEHLYTNAVGPYVRAPHLLLGFPKRFLPDRRRDPAHGYDGLSDGVLMASRDGRRWERWTEAFLRPGLDPANWTERNMMIAPGPIAAGPGELALFYIENYRHATARLRRGVLRADGFVSIHAGGEAGELLTVPLRTAGQALRINAATSAAGWLRCELCDVDGHPLPGFELAAFEPWFGDAIDEQVGWPGADWTTVADRPVRLRVRLKDADLYSFRFGDG